MAPLWKKDILEAQLFLVIPAFMDKTIKNFPHFMSEEPLRPEFQVGLRSLVERKKREQLGKLGKILKDLIPDLNSLSESWLVITDGLQKGPLDLDEAIETLLSSKNKGGFIKHFSSFRVFTREFLRNKFDKMTGISSPSELPGSEQQSTHINNQGKLMNFLKSSVVNENVSGETGMISKTSFNLSSNKEIDLKSIGVQSTIASQDSFDFTKENSFSYEANNSSLSNLTSVINTERRIPSGISNFLKNGYPEPNCEILSREQLEKENKTNQTNFNISSSSISIPTKEGMPSKKNNQVLACLIPDQIFLRGVPSSKVQSTNERRWE